MSDDVIREPFDPAFPPEAIQPVAIEDSPSVPVSKLTVVERVYHRQGNNPPLQIESKFEHVLGVDEATYFRPGMRVSLNWEVLDFGWVKREDVGTIVIQNITGRYLAKVPTPEAKRELDQTILEIGISCKNTMPQQFTMIPPKQNLRLNLLPDWVYSIRSRRVNAEFNLWAIPR